MQPAHRSATAALLLALCAMPAHAASLDAFLDDLGPAYSGVRNAILYLQRGAAGPAAFRIEAAAETWRRAVLPHAESPPAAFADDPRFAQTLRRIGDDLRRAGEAGGTDAALDAIEGIPARLAELRARNHIVVFTDHVHEANRAMERLWAYRDREIDFSERSVVDDLRARLAVTAYTFRQCNRAAPDEVSNDPAFRRIIDGTLASLDQMWEVIAAGDQQAVVNILREVRALDRLLWLHHG